MSDYTRRVCVWVGGWDVQRLKRCSFSLFIQVTVGGGGCGGGGGGEWCQPGLAQCNRIVEKWVEILL